jgi:hypothetical protein
VIPWFFPSLREGKNPGGKSPDCLSPSRSSGEEPCEIDTPLRGGDLPPGLDNFMKSKMTITKYSLFGLFFILFCGIAYSNGPYQFSGEYEVEITGHGNDGKDAFCNDFRLTPKQVKFFFRKANRITTYQLAHDYDWLSCYVTGTVLDKTGKYTWEMRPIGIGRLVTPSGEIIWLGCKTCDEIF